MPCFFVGGWRTSYAREKALTACSPAISWFDSSNLKTMKKQSPAMTDWWYTLGVFPIQIISIKLVNKKPHHQMLLSTPLCSTGFKRFCRHRRHPLSIASSFVDCNSCLILLAANKGSTYEEPMTRSVSSDGRSQIGWAWTLPKWPLCWRHRTWHPDSMIQYRLI